MSIVSFIDHAVLQPTHTAADVRAACQLGRQFGVASVCVKPAMVRLAAEWLAGSHTVPSTVIGFPHGGTTTDSKVYETKTATRQGAREVDMVVNLGWVLAENWDAVAQEILAVRRAASAGGALTKVIFETGLLPEDNFKVRLCQLCEEAEVAFVKTSTGYGFIRDSQGAWVATGATEHDIRLLRASCSDKVQVKASGGIRSRADAERCVALGATRLGTSSTQAIAQGLPGTSQQHY